LKVKIWAFTDADGSNLFMLSNVSTFPGQFFLHGIKNNAQCGLHILLSVVLCAEISKALSGFQLNLTLLALYLQPLLSNDQSSWLQIQRSRVRFRALPDFVRSGGSGMGSTQSREENWGATWMEN
jgi:hypothetical protein